MKNPKVEQCVGLIKKAKTIGVLTGAGISTGAGIPDFRGPKGLYVTRQYDPDTVFDIGYFHHDPKPFFAFARDFLTLEGKMEPDELSKVGEHSPKPTGSRDSIFLRRGIKPTFTHYFLAKLEKDGKLKGIVTQNIDSLHQTAGSKNVYEFHGSFWTSHCLKCHKEFSFEDMKKKLKTEDIPKCPCSGVVKPDIVFFGENVRYHEESVQLAESVDLFFVIGTSCVVYPAASIPGFARGQIIIVNQSEVKLPLMNVVLSVEEDLDTFFREVDKLLNL